MKKNAILSCFLALLVLQIQAQEEITMPRIRLGAEAGFSLLWGDAGEFDRIRESRSYYSYYDDDYYGVLPERAFADLSYFGVKLEYVTSKRFAFTTGLRYSEYNISVKADNAFAIFNRNYFLWKINEDGTNTDYVSLNSISQKNQYIGIPLEVRFFPREKDYFVRQYFVAGMALNFLMKTENNVSFKHESMEYNLPVIQKQIGEPNVVMGNLYVGIGMKIGNSKHPFGNIEIHFPVITGVGDEKTLVTTPVGFGMRTTFQLPIPSKHQLTYTVDD